MSYLLHVILSDSFQSTLYLLDSNQILVLIIQMIWCFSCASFPDNLFQNLHKQHNLLHLPDILKQS